MPRARHFCGLLSPRVSGGEDAARGVDVPVVGRPARRVHDRDVNSIGSVSAPQAGHACCGEPAIDRHPGGRTRPRPRPRWTWPLRQARLSARSDREADSTGEPARLAVVEAQKPVGDVPSQAPAGAPPPTLRPATRAAGDPPPGDAPPGQLAVRTAGRFGRAGLPAVPPVPTGGGRCPPQPHAAPCPWFTAGTEGDREASGPAPAWSAWNRSCGARARIRLRQERPAPARHRYRGPSRVRAPASPGACAAHRSECCATTSNSRTARSGYTPDRPERPSLPPLSVRPTGIRNDNRNRSPKTPSGLLPSRYCRTLTAAFGHRTTPYRVPDGTCGTCPRSGPGPSPAPARREAARRPRAPRCPRRPDPRSTRA